VIDGPLKRLEQNLCIAGTDNDPAVDLRLPVFRVELTKLDKELGGVMTDLEIVGVSPNETARFK
jgi:hypothetical protein